MANAKTSLAGYDASKGSYDSRRDALKAQILVGVIFLGLIAVTFLLNR